MGNSNCRQSTVILWRKRFVELGLDGVWDIAPERGRKPIYEIDQIAAIVDATVQTKPAGMAHWSCRTLAEQQGVSKSTVNNIWRAHNLQPHRPRTFKLSRDARFLEKMTDVISLYLNPPQKAIVLCVDEKSQIQALDRTQPGLPIKKGRCGTMTHDYKRNGTSTLCAALETLQGRVVGECHQCHRQSGVFEVPAPTRSGVSRRRSAPSDHGQLWHSQTPERQGMSKTLSSLRSSLCAHQFQLDEPRRALVRSSR